ncbi:metalloprotease, partial [Coemansia sp. RSA 1694]
MDFCKDYSLPDWRAGFEQRKTSVSQLPCEEYTGPMEKSASDANNYRLIRLPNNLVVMCVQDTQTETAAAALSVDVGSNMDPVELQGLAHFLEHMLFMGTEKYPDENEFIQLARKLSNPEHPFSKFLVGNIESLKQSAKDNGLDLHEELLNFYNKYYSSDIMKLVVCGNHSLDRLVEWAASKFSDIKSNGDNVQRIFDHPLSAENLGKAVYVETIDDKHTINITFPVPYTKAMYRHDPFAYIAHLIGHEGQGSIKANLRNQGWAANLSASANTDENKGFAEFSIYINSAPEGLEHYVDVLHAVFAYVQMLVASGPQEWIYLEIATLRRIINVFMPNDFTVKSANMLGAAAVLRPTLLKLNDNFELWFKQDDQFATLKGSIMLGIKLPTANTSPIKNVMSI